MKRLVTFGALACVLACSNSPVTPPAHSSSSDGGLSSIDGTIATGDAGIFSSPDAEIHPSDGGAPSSLDGNVSATESGMPWSPDGSNGSNGSNGSDASTPKAWLAYNYSPSTRTLVPLAASVHGNVSGGDAGVLFGQPLRLNGMGGGVTLDFGREVGGIASVKFANASDAAQSVGLAFSESSQYIGPASDQSNGGVGIVDGALAVPVVPSTTYVMPANKLRGGFRYLSIYLSTTGWVEVSGVSLDFTPAPTMPIPNDYANYFFSSDDLLNRIWYAGAYTVQLNTIDPKQGRIWPAPASGWDNGATVGTGNSVIVDGAKRDRTIWPGDLGVSVPTAYVSTGDLASTMNSLDTLYAGQNMTTGDFPRSGPPLNGQNGTSNSDTYHLWTLVGSNNYFLYSGDKAWLDAKWAAYKHGLAFTTAKIASNGLLQVTGVKDWGRLGQGGQNIAANAILYSVLVSAADLAIVEGDTALSTTYATQAKTLKAAANATLWDATVGAYRDNPTSTLYPQDGNSLAVWFGLVDAVAKAQSITAMLHTNWNAYGAHTPECDPARATISPFAGSLELAAHFVANDDQAGLDLMRLEWGYMLNASIGTGSTFWEGYLDDGSFGYTGSYMSAAHGWSSGPTFALTQWVLGVAPDSAGGKTYHVIPHPGDLVHAEGMLSMAPGKIVRVSYDHTTCGDFALRVDSSTHTGSVGVVGIPKFGKSRVVQLNGTTVWDGNAFVGSAAGASADEDANYVYVRGMAPAQATFTFYPRQCP